MALNSFEVNDQCSVTSWAVQETGMLPLLSCDSDMTARGRTGDVKATGASKYQLGIIYAHK